MQLIVNLVKLKYPTNECAICLDSMNSQTLTISCGHTYHSNCLLNWFEYNMTCPVCRTQFIWAKKKKKKDIIDGGNSLTVIIGP